MTLPDARRTLGLRSSQRLPAIHTAGASAPSSIHGGTPGRSRKQLMTRIRPSGVVNCWSEAPERTPGLSWLIVNCNCFCFGRGFGVSRKNWYEQKDAINKRMREEIKLHQ